MKARLAWLAADELIASRTHEIRSSQLCGHPLLSVSMITYNHGRFIREAIESVLAQETDFPIELVIGDDCSTDETAEIALDFQRRDPDKIRILVATENLGKHTGSGRLNFIRTLRATRGKYVALLDGDDYWSDPLKLKKQVAALESNPSLVACFAQAHRRIDKSSEEPVLCPRWAEDACVDLSCFLKSNPFATATCVFRKSCLPDLPDTFLHLPFGDLGLYILLTRGGGQALCLAEPMAVYRINAGSQHGHVHLNPTWENLSTAYMQTISFYKTIRLEIDLAASHVREVSNSICDNYSRIIDLSLQDAPTTFLWRCIAGLLREGSIGTAFKRSAALIFRDALRLFSWLRRRGSRPDA